MERTKHSWPFGESEMAERIRAFNWVETSLGAIASWPANLKTTIQLVLDQSNPSCIVIGTDRVFVYNDAYAALLDYRHPAALGSNIYKTFSEADLAHHLEPAYAGKNLVLKDEHIPSVRQGVVDPAWFEVSYVPVREEKGDVFAVLILIQETTSRVLSDTGRADRRAQQSFLLNLMDSLQTINEPREIQRVGMRMLGEHLNVDRAFYFDAMQRQSEWVNLVQQEFHHGSKVEPMSSQFVASMYTSKVVAELLRNNAVVVDDVRTHTLIAEDQARELGEFNIQSFVLVPIHKQGRYCGGICVHENVARHWSDDSVALLREVTERIGRAIGVARSNDLPRPRIDSRSQSK